MENEGNNSELKDSVSAGQNLESMNSAVIPSAINTDAGAIAGQSVETARSGGGKKKVILFALAAFFVLAGVLAFYFITKANPADILKASSAETAKVKTYSFAGAMNYSVNIVGADSKSSDSEKTEVDADVKIEISGKQDVTDPENPKGDEKIKIEAGFSSEGGSQKFSADMDAVTLGPKKVYYKLNDYDLGIFGFIYGGLLSPLKNKWYYVDAEKLKEMSPTASADSLEMNKKLLEAYSKYDFFKFKKDLGDDKVGDVAAYHYEVSLDRKAITDFYFEVLDVVSKDGAILTPENKSYLNDFKNDVDRSGDILDEVFSNIKTEIWIGKKDKIIRRVAVNANFDEKVFKAFEEKMKEISPLGGSSNNLTEDVNATIIFGLDFSLANINEPVVIEEPADAGDLLEALEAAMSNSFAKSVATPADTDKDGLSDTLERIYKTDPVNPDTDGDGYKDGDEVKNGFDPLNKVKGAKLKK